MNKNDKILLLVLLLLASFICIITVFMHSNAKKDALVYYEDRLILTIDLSDNTNKTYEVDGKLGKVVLEKNDGKVRVLSENSPNHICSKQGYIKESYEVLICLPNRIVIKIEDQEKIDTVVK